MEFEGDGVGPVKGVSSILCARFRLTFSRGKDKPKIRNGDSSIGRFHMTSSCEKETDSPALWLFHMRSSCETETDESK